MADFNSIVNDVYVITNRPDLVKETQLAVRSATLQLHRMEFFYKDIFETPIQFDTADYLQTIDCKALFPRYRALKYLRKYDPYASGEGAGPFLTRKTPENILDSYGVQLSDIWYAAGQVIQVRSSTQLQYALIGVYLNPDVSADSYNSWIANEAYYAIVYKAASIVFGTVLGDLSRQKANDEQAQLEMIEVKNSNIVAEGY